MSLIFFGKVIKSDDWAWALLYFVFIFWVQMNQIKHQSSQEPCSASCSLQNCQRFFNLAKIEDPEYLLGFSWGGFLWSTLVCDANSNPYCIPTL